MLWYYLVLTFPRLSHSDICCNTILYTWSVQRWVMLSWHTDLPKVPWLRGDLFFSAPVYSALVIDNILQPRHLIIHIHLVICNTIHLYVHNILSVILEENLSSAQVLLIYSLCPWTDEETFIIYGWQRGIIWQKNSLGKNSLMPVSICKIDKHLIILYNVIFLNMTGILSHLSYIFY